jgi:alpha-ketoglutarate-dependent taurine dioxygenase
MKITDIPGIGNYGVYIDDVDFASMTDDEWMEIGKLHLQKLVTIIRNVDVDWLKLTSMSEMWGNPRYNIRYNILKKHPGKTWAQLAKLAMIDSPKLEELDKVRLKLLYQMSEIDRKSKQSVIRVSGQRDSRGEPLGMFADGDLLWHSNESGSLSFTPGVALLGAKNVVGSSTGFLTTPDYYQSVSESFRSELDEMVLVHNFSAGRINPGLNEQQDKIMHANMCPDDNTEIPLVITSPGGIKGLHYSINTIESIKGMSVEDSKKVFDEINKNLFVDKYIYDHWYQNDNDLLLFDNSITLHRRLGDIKDRLCYRLQTDYTGIQEGYWQPYRQTEYAELYRTTTADYDKVLGFS